MSDELQKSSSDHSDELNDSKSYYLQHFRDAWLEEPLFKDWLKKDYGNTTRAYCRICKQNLKAKYNDLKRHRLSTKHRNKCSSISGIKISDKNSSMKRKKSVRYGSVKVGFVGFNDSAIALLHGIVSNGLATAENICAYEVPHDKVNSALGIEIVYDINLLFNSCNMIFSCFSLGEVSDITSTLVVNDVNKFPLIVSIVPFLSLSVLENAFEKAFNSPHVARVTMNKTSFSQCYSFALGNYATEAEGKTVETLLATIGFCSRISENVFEATNALISSGPALVYLMIESLSEGAMKMGLPDSAAQKLSCQMVKGTASLALEKKDTLSALRKSVCNMPRAVGHGIHELERHKARYAIMSYVEEAIRSQST